MVLGEISGVALVTKWKAARGFLSGTIFWLLLMSARDWEGGKGPLHSS